VGVTGPTGRGGATGPTGSSVTGHATGTAVAGSVTINATAGLVTSESLTSQTTYTLTLINNTIVASSLVIPVAYTASGVITAGVTNVTPSNGSASIVLAFSASLTGTVKIFFQVLN
jgi:hypothetical protein